MRIHKESIHFLEKNSGPIRYDGWADFPHLLKYFVILSVSYLNHS